MMRGQLRSEQGQKAAESLAQDVAGLLGRYFDAQSFDVEPQQLELLPEVAIAWVGGPEIPQVKTVIEGAGIASRRISMGRVSLSLP